VQKAEKLSEHRSSSNTANLLEINDEQFLPQTHRFYKTPNQRYHDILPQIANLIEKNSQLIIDFIYIDDLIFK
jgi:hypothetical protein